jgi:hypothetical protein
VTAAVSLLSPSSVIDAALRAHHKRKPFENLYVAGPCYVDAQSVSNKLTHGTGEKKGSKLLRSLFMVALWLSYDLRKTGFIKLKGKKILGTLPLLQKPRTLQSAKPISL